MTRLTASQAQTDLTGVLRRVASGGERIVLRQRGKDMAALIPMDEFKSLERQRRETEDRADAAAFKRAKRQFEKIGQPGAPLEQVKKRLGL
jgi:prevent-host-death family protein